MNKILVSILIVLFFGGCSIKDIGRPIVKYSVYDGSPMKTDVKTDKILKISQFKAPINLLGSKIWYKRDSFATNSYLYSSWNEDFSSIIEHDIANRLYKSGLFKSVFERYSKVKADLSLEGEIINVIQNVSKNGANVSFEIRLYLIDLKSSRLIASKDFLYHKRCGSVNAIGAVKAYNQIIKIFNKEVVLWLKTLVKEN